MRAMAVPTGEEAVASCSQRQTGSIQAFSRRAGMRRSCSVPVLVDEGRGSPSMDVYVGTRPFIKFGTGWLPDALREGPLCDLGICHFYVVVKAPDGTLSKFDFGPMGGRDITLSQPRSGPWALLTRQPRPRRRGEMGEIREEKVRPA